MLFFSPLDVLYEIWDLVESVSVGGGGGGSYLLSKIIYPNEIKSYFAGKIMVK